MSKKKKLRNAVIINGQIYVPVARDEHGCITCDFYKENILPCACDMFHDRLGMHKMIKVSREEVEL